MGVPDKKCGVPILCSAAQRLNEAQVTTGASERFERMRGGTFVFTTRAMFFFSKPGADQFSEEFSFDTVGDEMVSSGGLDVVAQPAKKIAAAKMIPVVLNTRPFC
jgi:hypothetical protein